MEGEGVNQQSYNRQISDAIRKLAGITGKPVSFLVGNVTEVDFAERTCSVEVIMGEENMTLTDIRLSAEKNDGFILVPAVDSTVIVALLQDNTGYVFATSDIDKLFCYVDASNKLEFDSSGFVLNDGLNSGMIKINDLTTKLNLLVTQLQAQLGLIAAGIVAAGGTYTPGALSPFVAANYENTKVKH